MPAPSAGNQFAPWPTYRLARPTSAQRHVARAADPAIAARQQCTGVILQQPLDGLRPDAASNRAMRVFVAAVTGAVEA